SLGGRLGVDSAPRMADNDRVTEWLIDEAREAGQRISAVFAIDERVLATGLTVIGLAGTVAVAQGKPYFLMVLPGALAALFCFLSYRYAELFAIAGYKHVLEIAIKERLGVPVIAWESEIASRTGVSSPVVVRSRARRRVPWS